jgi:hypothetical protein
MRARCWAVLMTVAVAAPFGAYAENYQVPDKMAITAGSNLAVVRDGTKIRVVDTYVRPRGFDNPTRVDGSVPRLIPAATPHAAATPTAAPEINAGFAASALTLLLGSVAVLRGRRSRSHAI